MRGPNKLFALCLLSLLWAADSMESGEKSFQQAHIQIMLQEVRPELKSSRKEIRKMIKELESKKQRDIYEQSLLEQLRIWLKDPSFTGKAQRS